MVVLYLKIISSATLPNVEMFMLVSGIAQSWFLAALLLEPHQANLCLRAFRHDKF